MTHIDEQKTTRKLNSTRKGIVSGIFRDGDQAEEAYDRTKEFGYGKDDISVLMSEQAREEYFPHERVEVEEENKALEGAGVGGAVGLTAGAVAGALAAVGTTITLPGLGLVLAGPIVGALAGGGAGAAAGEIVGALVGAGMSEERARVYRTAIEEGGVVLVVEPESEEDAEEIVHAWEDAGAEEVHRS